MKSKFKLIKRGNLYLFPASIDDLLPSNHTARFVMEIISCLDLTPFEKKYSHLGRKAYPVDLMLGLLFYGYITGVSSSRKIEEATFMNNAFRFIASNEHPDHDTIAHFRKQFLGELAAIFTQILVVASEMGFLKMGNVSTDGSKIKANASKHKALSYEYAQRLEKQLKAEVEELIKKAELADAADIPEDMNIPEELLIREKRLATIAKAMQIMEERSEERFKKEQAEYDEKVEQDQKLEKETGKKKKGRKRQAPSKKIEKTDQVNLTDEDSRIMPKSGGGFEQAYNAQLAVDHDSHLIVTNHISQCTNDKLELEVTLKNLKQAEESTGKKVENICADTGYYSKENVTHCIKQAIKPLIPQKRERHNKSLTERFEYENEIPPDLDEVTTMKMRLKTKEGKKLYAKRKSTAEPPFGVIKNVMNVKSFLLRGLESVKGEWLLICIAYNLKRLSTLRSLPAPN